MRRGQRRWSQFPGGAEMFELPGKLFVHEERPADWAAIARRALEACTAPRLRAVTRV